MKLYYALFGLTMAEKAEKSDGNKENETKIEDTNNGINSEDDDKEKKKTIFEEVHEVLSLRKDVNDVYKKNAKLFEGLNEFCYIF